MSPHSRMNGKWHWRRLGRATNPRSSAPGLFDEVEVRHWRGRNACLRGTALSAR